MQAQTKTWFPWKDAYSVRVPEIDAQHKRLVEIINRLQDAMLQGQGKTVIAAVLADLESYTKSHFTFEEQLLARHGYPQFLAHEAQHKGFIARMAQFQADYRSGSITLTVPVMEFLRNWLTQHILQEDRAYSAHLVEALRG
ncbi:bacteriohemerythrin [uncultured Paludibaculum sp.]|uniref:bacteriohemerythrin n=1 Tax=uncultured Paludibaculum sp. TaxID=1765020 RepID=UPI002AABB2B6|nr:bacteriohemerythrin [uncultured Paludibaculum sp.]